MVSGCSAEAEWKRAEARRSLSASTLERMVRAAFPSAGSVVEPMTAGLRNANFKVRIDSGGELVVLRVYEQNASLCQKEVDLIRLVGGAVPVPEVIHAEPRGLDDLPPFAFMRYVEGVTFRELKRSGDVDAIAQAAFSAGKALAAMGLITFAKPGWIGAGLVVMTLRLAEVNPLPCFVDSCCLSPNFQRRVLASLSTQIRDFFWERAGELAGLENEKRLVHGDFNRRNLMVRRVAGKWCVAAVLDWEFAISGTPLADLGSFLRYERESGALAEPHLSAGYLEAGGTLPQRWRQLARWIDLAVLCESLTHDQLPDSVTLELIDLASGTVGRA